MYGKMGNLIDLTGQRFGRWVVLEKAPRRPKVPGSFWLCKCDCGTIKEVHSRRLRDGSSTSCGCWRREWASEANSIHHMVNTRLYRIWFHMRQRCANVNAINYKSYGGRGITVCDEWQSFLPFYEWAIKSGYDDSLTIDRIDNDKGYSPSNCRWVDAITQANNKRNNHYITVGDKTESISSWARITGIERSTITKRIESGWSEVEAVTIPKGERRCKK